MSDPERVLVAGDWHCSRRWAVDVIWRARKLLDGEEQKVIVQLGDFGFFPWKDKQWAEGDTKPEALRYLLDVQAALELTDATILVTPGNHDDYDAIERWSGCFPADHLPVYPQTPMGPMDRIVVLPRGRRWQWHGRTWLSVGGAVSVDRLLPRPARVQGVDWWPQEEVTAEQEAAIITGGHADVMVTHDTPSFVSVPYDHHREPYFAPEDLERAARHRERMARITEGVTPGWYLHGHHHLRYRTQVSTPWGPLQVDGMGMNGDPQNFAVLNVRTMTWEQGSATGSPAAAATGS